ncbi:MAG: TlpA family protein disulfide reductase [Planctomycetota bacterium]|nr:MAG: TlpA family protein disulfide reductase [Planctomycetota bacterium]
MKMRMIVCAVAALAATLAVAQPVIHPPGHDLAREGTGQRREALDKMELKPFDQSQWDNLSDWTNGPALDRGSTHGKVVLIYSWTSYLPTTLRPIAALNRLVDEYGDRGLVVVGVHPDVGWEDAAKVVKQRRAKFVVAHDASGALREYLMIDQDPDFYLIDRAGRMRFADLDTSALNAAVELLINETTEQAEGLLDRLKREEEAADREFGKTFGIRQEFHLSDIPDLPFAQPSEEVYASVQWPKIPEDEEDRSSRRGQEQQFGRMPEFEDTDFLPSKPNFKGRVTVAYFFNPKEPRSYAYLAEANRLQEAHGRDVVVLGVMTPLEDPNARRSRRDAEAIDPAQWTKDLVDFAMARTPRHWLVSDIAGRMSSALDADRRRSRQDSGVFAVGNMPYVALVSSDGVIRWHGPASSRWFKFMLDELLRVDPAVLERRKVEEEYRRSRNGG